MTDIFHITHVRNLESIIQCGGLYCDRVRADRQLASVGIAHNHIKERRARRHVPTCQLVAAAGLDFTFTEGHAELAYSSFFEDLVDLDKVDWRIMRSRWWNDTVEDMDRKRRRQAEFLVHDFFPWELVTRIGVINDDIAEQVNEVLQGPAHRPTVVVERTWYY